MCMEMTAEGALGLSENLGTCQVNPPFSAIMEGKESREVSYNKIQKNNNFINFFHFIQIYFVFRLIITSLLLQFQLNFDIQQNLSHFFHELIEKDYHFQLNPI